MFTALISHQQIELNPSVLSNESESMTEMKAFLQEWN